jgi:hypothetical protein
VRPSVDSGRHRGEGHGLGPELVRDPQRLGVTGRQDRRPVLGGGVDRAHGVDHPSGRELARGGRHRLAGRQAARVAARPHLAARRQDRRAAATVDRPVHSAAAEQGRVRRVDDGIGPLRGDVADLQGDPHVCEFSR